MEVVPTAPPVRQYLSDPLDLKIPPPWAVFGMPLPQPMVVGFDVPPELTTPPPTSQPAAPVGVAPPAPAPAAPYALAAPPAAVPPLPPAPSSAVSLASLHRNA